MDACTEKRTHILWINSGRELWSTQEPFEFNDDLAQGSTKVTVMPILGLKHMMFELRADAFTN